VQRFDLADSRKMNVGVWDIETSGLNANFGHMLAGSVMPLWGRRKDVKIVRIDDYPRYKKSLWDDTLVVAALVAELNKYDVLIGHNSVNFDAKFLNSRALDNRTGWIRQEIKHVDSRRTCKKFLRFGYRSLENLSIFLDTKDRKTPLVAKLWKKAICGDKECLDQIVKHNVQDVITLQEIVKIILPCTWMPYEYVR
jgi:uncharacterized protein YprB with RNaseH-like and TPR domain